MRLPVNYTELTAQQRRLAREEYISRQGGACSHCHAPLRDPPHPTMLAKTVNLSLFPTGFFRYSIHLHHDHETGMTKGAVHARCNAILWQYHGE